MNNTKEWIYQNCLIIMLIYSLQGALKKVEVKLLWNEIFNADMQDGDVVDHSKGTGRPTLTKWLHFG